MSAPSGEVIEEEEEPATSGKVTIDRPTYDELQFEETFHPLGYQRLKVNRNTKHPLPRTIHLTCMATHNYFIHGNLN